MSSLKRLPDLATGPSRSAVAPALRSRLVTALALATGLSAAACTNSEPYHAPVSVEPTPQQLQVLNGVVGELHRFNTRCEFRDPGNRQYCSSVHANNISEAYCPPKAEFNDVVRELDTNPNALGDVASSRGQLIRKGGGTDHSSWRCNVGRGAAGIPEYMGVTRVYSEVRFPGSTATGGTNVCTYDQAPKEYNGQRWACWNHSSSALPR
ncbi:hypothetical protein CO046_02475 [Candidatus Peregrinibacteria bacterium CG_4_9_14_0_2_um_filter_53_11]|nr:MAG: hypothetical protein CO046_02475 [Candidatus Peregrinibacteria bacterium CG_4_9_14_0_2_um_filter_53_11]